MDKNKIYWFDMDHTLINNDCDVSWKNFMISEKLAEKSATELMAAKFFADYRNGTLDMAEFMNFQLREFIGQTVEKMAQLSQKHFDLMVKPLFYTSALETIRKVHFCGARCAIVTSTNEVIARPAADYLGIKELFAPKLETVNNKYTGRLAESYTIGHSKVTVMEKYCKMYNVDPQDIVYYGDSINDCFIMEKTGTAIAVNPDDKLRKKALENSWQIIEFR